MQTRVLVVSASMGAGHDGAARELVRRLKADGHEAEMRDFLTSPPLGIGTLLKSSYEFQMRHVAWSYDLTYRLWYRLPALCPPLGRFMARLTGSHLLAWAKDYQADVVVSTYPLTSVVLGQLRLSGRLTVPTINFITDFGVHPLWTHPGIDLNLAVHPRPAALAEAKSGRPSIATGPMVSPPFFESHDRAAARRRLGLGDDERAVLIVSGSWGVGHVDGTFRAIAASGHFVPVVVCGRDEHLRERLSRIPGGRVLGWTDDMAALMSAADVLVENAGGLTAMESLAIGLPIISYRPIAGHGKENTAEMQAVGVSRVARTPRQLLQFLEEITAPGPVREGMISAGKAMFVADAAHYVTYAATAGAGGLADRGRLAALAQGSAGTGLDWISGATTNGVDFDPARELQALLASSRDRSSEPQAQSAGRPGDRPGPLAPVVPITAGRRGDGSQEGGRGRRPRRPSVAVARIAALVALVPLLWAGLTSGVNVATAYGAGVAHPASHSGNVAFIGVRLDDAQLTDPVIAQQLAELHATAVVDERTAAADPADVQRLVSLGVDVENGGAGVRLDSQGHRVGLSPWARASGDVGASRLLARIAGQRVTMFVPGRRLNAFDLMASSRAHNKTVVADRLVQPTDDDPLRMTARHTYLVIGAKATTEQMQSTLADLSVRLKAANLSGAPLSDLV